jgi:hypothetical protein
MTESGQALSVSSLCSQYESHLRRTRIRYRGARRKADNVVFLGGPILPGTDRPVNWLDASISSLLTYHNTHRMEVGEFVREISALRG